MPLTECPKCGGKVSTRAVGCPHCKKKTVPSSSDASRRDLDQFIKKGDDTYVDPETYELGSGSVLSFHDDAKKQIKLWGSLKDGRFHGPFETYYKSGQLEKKGTYKDGNLQDRLEKYFKDGQLEWRRTYKDGDLDGPVEVYQKYWDKEEGRYGVSLRRKKIFKDGVVDGPFEVYEDGVLLRKGIQRNGTRHGPFECYRAGTLIEKGTYNMGVKCGEWVEEHMWLWGLRKKTYPPCPHTKD